MKSSMKKFSIAVIVASSLGVAPSAWAITTYSYTGNNFNSITNDIWLPVPGEYTTAMHVSGLFEVAGPIAANASNLLITPLSYSFSDDRSTYTNLDSVLSNPNSFEVSTDGAGNIFNWFIGVQRCCSGGNLWTINDPIVVGLVYDYGAVEVLGPTTQRDNAIVYNNPGVWTSTTPVPEPETYAMLLAGLGLLGFTARRRKNNTA